LAQGIERRHYFRDPAWIAEYQKREDTIELLNHLWLLGFLFGPQEEYTKKQKDAVRQHFARHVKKGILSRNKGWPTSYRLLIKSCNINNVTPAAISATTDKENTSSEHVLNVNNLTLVCNTKCDISNATSSTERVRKHRENKRNGSMLTVGCAYKYGEIGKRARVGDRGFYDALDTAMISPTLFHNLAFMLHTMKRPDPALFGYPA
jgi:hypothetical protein